ncbi:unnamed protein product, partial [Prorocentrum cordatum]
PLSWAVATTPTRAQVAPRQFPACLLPSDDSAGRPRARSQPRHAGRLEEPLQRPARRPRRRGRAAAVAAGSAGRGCGAAAAVQGDRPHRRERPSCACCSPRPCFQACRPSWREALGCCSPATGQGLHPEPRIIRG